MTSKFNGKSLLLNFKSPQIDRILQLVKVVQIRRQEKAYVFAKHKKCMIKIVCNII